jgi:hypothetical protein
MAFPAVRLNLALNFPRIICYGWAGEKAKMKEYKMPHPNHENHLCYLENIGYIQEFPEVYKDLVKRGKFFCKVCGRVAKSEENLCIPEKL